jgi:putative membrane protein
MRSHVLLGLGALALGAAWLGPLPRLAERAFFVHMILHMLVVAVAASLLALGLAGGRFDPVRRFPALFPPLPASLVEFAVVWAWHAPALHHAARHGMPGLIAEQAGFLLSGLYLWLAAFGGDPQKRAERAGAGVAALLLTAMHMTLLGALLALSTRPLYGHQPGFSALTPLEDQQLGGAVMLVAGGVAYLAGGLWLMAELLGRRVRAEERRA